MTYDEWFYSQFQCGQSPFSWNATGIDLITTGSTEQLQRKLEFFFSKMEVEFMGPGNVAKLIEGGIRNPVSAILNSGKFEAIVGELGRKATVSLTEKLSATTPARLFAALGSFGHGMGERKLTALFNVFPVGDVLSGQVGIDSVVSIPGFEVKSAQLILENCSEAKRTYAEIYKFVTFKKPKADFEKALTGSLVGQVFCATGVRISEADQCIVESKGGRVIDSFNSVVTTLVTKDLSSGSAKIQKARDKGIKVITLEHFKELING
jgi:NAD-dependent DNA ligase